MKRLIFIIISLVGTILLFSQTVEETVSTYFEQLKVGQGISVNTQVLYQPENLDKAYELLLPYAKDSLPTVKYNAYSLIGKIVQVKGISSAEREKITDFLIEGVGNIDYSSSDECISTLNRLKPSSLTEQQQKRLIAIAGEKETLSVDYLLLLGQLNPSDVQPFLQQIYYTKRFSKQALWTRRVALARTGDTTQINYLLNKAKKYPLDENIVNYMVPDFVYTRQRVLVQYVVSLLYSDSKKCTSNNPEVDANILCAYRIMEKLAPIIQNFPLEVDKTGEITTDYPKALNRLRKWFEKNPNFVIVE